MAVEETLVTVLASIGHPAYPLSVPSDGTYPCTVYQVISNVPIKTHSGNVGEKLRVQVSCWGVTYEEAKTVSTAVKTALDLNKVDFKLATRQNEFDEQEPESSLCRKVLEFFIWQ